GRVEEAQALDDGRELHAVVGRLRIVAVALGEDLAVADLDHAPAAGPGVAEARPVGEHASLRSAVEQLEDLPGRAAHRPRAASGPSRRATSIAGHAPSILSTLLTGAVTLTLALSPQGRGDRREEVMTRALPGSAS